MNRTNNTPTEDQITAATEHIADTLMNGDTIQIGKISYDSADLLGVASEKQLALLTKAFTDIAATPDDQLDSHALRFKQIACDIAYTFASNNADEFVRDHLEESATNRAIDRFEDERLANGGL